MSFFPEPVRLPDAARPAQPAMPQWLGPPAFELPAVVPQERVLYRTERFLLAVPAVEAYSTGLRFGLRWALRRGQESDAGWSKLSRACMTSGPLPPEAQQEGGLRCGFAFTDGRKVTSADAGPWPTLPGDEPSGPVLRGSRGGGGGGPEDVRGTGELWLWPVPPAGPLTLVADWQALGMPEVASTFDGGLLAAAATRATPYWN